MLVARLASDALEARQRLEESISSGRAREKFGQLIEAQGGNPAVLDDPAALPQADVIEIFNAPRDGVVRRVEPRRIGRASAKCSSAAAGSALRGSSRRRPSRG